MTELDADLVLRKLASILRNLETLESVRDLPLEEYRHDRIRRKATERMLREVVEAAVDVNLHLVRGEGRPPPSDYFESFLEAGRCGAIDARLAEELAPAAGLRNRIVHEYDALDDALVLEAVGRACRRFRRYVDAVERSLEEAGF